MKKLICAAAISFAVSCTTNEKKNVEKGGTKIDTASKKEIEPFNGNASTSKNPELDMDFVFANVKRKSNASIVKYKNWLESLEINTFDSDADYPMLSSEVKKLWNDMKDLEFDSETNFTRKMFDEKWKDKVDYKYLGWYQYFYDGQDGPEKVKLKADQIGSFDNAYYYKITVSDSDKNGNWPSQTGKIFKVENVDGNPLITGIYEKGESIVWPEK